jgi:uncharacterized protein
MEIELKAKPKNPVILEGFPGFGLVATIATEYLLEHMDFVSIGRIISDEIPPVALVHGNKVVKPLELFYSKKYNLILLQGLANMAGLEWKLAEIVIQLAKVLGAKEVISIEGIGSTAPSKKSAAYCYTSNKQKSSSLKKAGCNPLKEGVIVGVTGALILTADSEVPITAIFAETASNLPDSKAAAKIIEVLDSYLGLKVDAKPLLKRAQEFEAKLKGFVQQAQKVAEEKKLKDIPYVG